MADKGTKEMMGVGGVGAGHMMAGPKQKKQRPSRWIAGLLLSLALLAGALMMWSGPSPSIPAAAMDNGWELVLVNRDNALPLGWEPELIALSNGSLVDVRIYPALQQMFDDMRSQGVYPTVRDGWRSKEVQEQLLKGKVQEFRKQGYTAIEAQAMAENWVALPGTSEHQLGLAVDINPDTSLSTGDQVYGWLAAHAHEYGFIRRYPPDKTEITGISNEPWHYRYVGRRAAVVMHDKNLCLEEYIALVG